jgi:transcriptional regulator with XRE-family HTH domain
MNHTGRQGKSPDGNRTLTQDPRKLRRLRIAAGLDLRGLAAKAALSSGSLCDLENGNQSARPGTLAALAKALDCQITDLMQDEAA